MATVQPLTTTFIPNPTCFQTLIRLDGTDSLGPSPSASECYPSGWKAKTDAYFSPGLCPSSYTSAFSTTKSVGTLTDTVVHCCPSSFDWQVGGVRSDVTSCVSSYDVSSTRTLVHYAGTSSASVVTTAGYGWAVAPMVQVGFQATDLSVLSPSLGVIATEVVTETRMATTTAASEGLGTGTKVGIGIGVPLAILLLVAIGFGIRFLILRRKRAGRVEEASSGESKTRYNPDLKAELDDHVTGELDGTTFGHHIRVYELDESRRF